MKNLCKTKCFAVGLGLLLLFATMITSSMSFGLDKDTIKSKGLEKSEKSVTSDPTKVIGDTGRPDVSDPTEVIEDPGQR